ncbi:MAG: COP23 domain-containing protein [Cyanobacteria bacterium J06600_6]
MKLSSWINILAGCGLFSSIIFSHSQSANGQGRFFCDEQQISTTVTTERGAVPLIQWTNNSFPPPYSPTERCRIVSDRFQTFDHNGTLKYIKPDQINNLPVLCVAAYKGGSCLPNGLLVTFAPGTDANQALLRLLDRRVWAAKGAVNFCNGCDDNRIVSEVNGETFVDLESFLEWGDNP